MKYLVTLLTLSVFASASYAEDSSAPDTELDVIARDRLYEGGFEEEDLRVQESLTVPAQGVSEKSLQTKYMEEILNRKQASESESVNN